jgi:hypothetical protein
MHEERICEACGMAFDWAGVEENGVEYCCAACARGEACSCTRHEQTVEPEPNLIRAGTGPMGAPLDAPGG